MMPVVGMRNVKSKRRAATLAAKHVNSEPFEPNQSPFFGPSFVASWKSGERFRLRPPNALVGATNIPTSSPLGPVPQLSSEKERNSPLPGSFPAEYRVRN